MNNESKSSKASKNTVFVGGLPGKADKATVQTYFSRFGPIKSIKMKSIDQSVGLNKGFAVIEFITASSFHSCLKNPEIYLFDRVVSCQPYLKGQELTEYLEDLNSRRLFIKFVPKSYSNYDFEQTFSYYGEVDFGYVVKDPVSKLSRGYGYITLKKEQDAQRLASMENLLLECGGKMKIFEYKRRGETNLVQQNPLRKTQAHIESDHSLQQPNKTHQRMKNQFNINSKEQSHALLNKSHNKSLNKIITQDFVPIGLSGYQSLLVSALNPSIAKNHNPGNIVIKKFKYH